MKLTEVRLGSFSRNFELQIFVFFSGVQRKTVYQWAKPGERLIQLIFKLECTSTHFPTLWVTSQLGIDKVRGNGKNTTLWWIETIFGMKRLLFHHSHSATIHFPGSKTKLEVYSKSFRLIFAHMATGFQITVHHQYPDAGI